ncbi:hypothetical protein BST61_g2551 [Cercospora zeina]
MSAPNADKPNEGIIGQAANSVKNAANYVSETVQGKSAEASKEANKEQAKGNTPNASIGEARGLCQGQQGGHLGCLLVPTPHKSTAMGRPE